MLRLKRYVPASVAVRREERRTFCRLWTRLTQVRMGSRGPVIPVSARAARCIAASDG